MAEPARGTGSRSAATRDAIVEAGLHLFAARGFDGASVHRIAERAGVHAPQISYHFGGKRGLWQAAVSLLFEELDHQLAAIQRPDDPEGTLRATIRVFVRFAAKRPELNRIVVAESGSDGERLAWLVRNHTKRRYDALAALVTPLQRAGVVQNIPMTSFYYLVVGGASLPFVAADEARHYSALDPCDPSFVEAHADAIETILFSQPPAAPRRQSRGARPRARRR